MDKKEEMRLREHKMEKIANAMEVFESAQHIIAKKALAFALLHEDDEEALDLFESMREHAAVEDEQILEYDGYMENLEGLREIAAMSEQTKTATDLSFLINYFRENEEIMLDMFKAIRRAHLYEGLRQNAHNN